MFNAYNDKGEYSCIYNTKELEKIVHDSMNYYEYWYNHFRESNKMLEENAKQCADIKLKVENDNLKRRLNLSYGEFSSEKEKEAYKNFTERHMHDRATSKINSGKAPYLIPNHTGIGTLLKVKCQICGEEEDITDTEVW